ncbi:MAG TPA: hypothetical protein VKN99_27155 [Polyangia bacterium]|nr:hypothetical protein [Polyangia bacterium]
MATREEIMKLHDGELSEAEAQRVRASLSAEDRLRLEALREIGDAVREQLEARAGASKLDVWAGISDRLDAEPAAVVPLRRRRSIWIASGVAVLAAAATAMALMVGPHRPLDGVTIESVDFGESAGMLFQIHDTKTTVLWQTTNEEEQE